MSLLVPLMLLPVLLRRRRKRRRGMESAPSGMQAQCVWGGYPKAQHSLVAQALWHGDDLWGIKELVVIVFIAQVSFGRAAGVWDEGEEGS